MRSDSPSLYVRRISASVAYSGMSWLALARRSTSLVQAELCEHLVVFPPFGLDADVEVQEHAGGKKAFELLAGGDAYLLDHFAALTDDDRLLRLPIDHDGAVETQERLAALDFLEL